MIPYTALVMRCKYRADSLRDELAAALWELRKLRRERQRYADAWREMSEIAYRLDNGWLSGAYTETEGLRADECRQNDRARGAVGLLARTVRRLPRERYDVTCWADDDGNVQWSEDRKP